MSFQRKVIRNKIRQKYGNKAVARIWKNMLQIRLQEIYGKNTPLWKKIWYKMVQLAKNKRKQPKRRRN